MPAIGFIDPKRLHFNCNANRACHGAVERFGGGNIQMICSIPVSRGFTAVESLFESLVSRHPGKSWPFGNVYDTFNDFAPIGW